MVLTPDHGAAHRRESVPETELPVEAPLRGLRAKTRLFVLGRPGGNTPRQRNRRPKPNPRQAGVDSYAPRYGTLLVSDPQLAHFSYAAPSYQ